MASPSPHPDGRPYPWLSSTEASHSSSGDEERFLIYQPFAGMCNQFSCLECAVALARLTGRTLVLPRWRPQYGCPWMGETADYFDAAQALGGLVRCATLDEFARARGNAAPGEGVALCRIVLEYNPQWSEKGWDLYPALRSLLDDLEYLREVDASGRLRLGCGGGGGGGVSDGGVSGGVSVESEIHISLARPLCGEREVASHFASVPQRVLALDHAFNIMALPSILDAGERGALTSALRPCARLRHKLNSYCERVPRPCLAAHVRRTDHWRLAELMGDARYYPAVTDLASQIRLQLERRRLRGWLMATDCADEEELRALRAVEGLEDSSALFARRADDAEGAEGGAGAEGVEGAEDGHEDGVAAAVLDMWLCVGADFFVGTRGSMYTEYINRFRVADGKVVDHIYFELPAASSPPAAASAPSTAAPSAAAPAAPAATAAPTPLPDVGGISLSQLLGQREEVRRAGREDATAADDGGVGDAAGGARGGAVLGMMSTRLPPELRERILGFPPQADRIPPLLSRTPRELFDELITGELPTLRAKPLVVAPAGSTNNVALLIEPRDHPALEHVIRNVMRFLNHRPNPTAAEGAAGPAAEGADGRGWSPGWQLQVFHGTGNEGCIRAAFSEDELSHVQLVSLQVDNLSTLAHNELMCTHWLWSRAAAERVLIFQTDSLLCRPGIDAFQTYDYVGAPWREDDLWCVGKPWLTDVGANGGLSLRSRERTLACIDSFGYLRGQAEDVFYAEAMPRVGGLIADRATGMRFSVESVFAREPLGFHAAYKWLSSEQMAELLGGVRRAYEATA